MKKKENDEFLMKYITTILKISEIYPPYCFERKEDNSIIYYDSLSPLLNNYLHTLINDLPIFKAIKIQIQELPELKPLFEFILLNNYNKQSIQSIFHSLLNVVKLKEIVKNKKEGCLTFQISILSHHQNDSFDINENNFFGNEMSLQPINSNGCCLLFRRYDS